KASVCTGGAAAIPKFLTPSPATLKAAAKSGTTLLQIRDNLTKGGGGFRIDHPLEPATKLLNHSFVESSVRKNIYDGLAVLDDDGAAVVELPRWFQKINFDFCYQLCLLKKSLS